jgi:nucleotide-binding universal stress UspA family protein
MRRILIPLDGSPFGEAVVPDACDLAGHHGELYLLHVIPSPTTNRGTGQLTGRDALKASEAYLESVAAPLRARGFVVWKRTEVRSPLSAAIDEAAVECEAEMVAMSTHGRGPGGRMLRGGITWKTLANSRVPVFLRRIGTEAERSEWPQRFQVMVPLDGSEYSEKALPVAERLSLKWNAPVWLVRVAEPIPLSAVAVAGVPGDRAMEVEQVEAYLASVSAALGGDVRGACLTGAVVPQLGSFAREHHVSHVIMASHGRTGLSRVTLGSVADDLIHELTCGIVVIPALAPGRLEEHNPAMPSPHPVGAL